MIKESYAAYSCYTYTYLNIGGLEVDEEKVPRHETNRNPNPKSQKPQNGTKETHFNSIFQLNPIPDRDFSPLFRLRVSFSSFGCGKNLQMEEMKVASDLLVGDPASLEKKIDAIRFGGP